MGVKEERVISGFKKVKMVATQANWDRSHKGVLRFCRRKKRKLKLDVHSTQ
jgi:hypothetical protein